MSSDRRAPGFPDKGPGDEGFVPLLETGQSDEVVETIDALRSAGIPYELGLKAEGSPRVLFSIPAGREAEARAAILSARAARADMPPSLPKPPPPPAPRFSPEDEDEAPGDDEEEPAEPVIVFESIHDGPFPWWAVRACLGLVVFHLALVAWSLSPLPPGEALLRWGGLVPGITAREPWRLLTSMFLHVDVPHALWNGVSMVVFAVPLLVELGYARTAFLYVVAGLGGSATALWLAAPGSVTVGSSGAVAGLFGAWVVRTLRETRGADLPVRARIRIVGVALLMLPSLLSPTTAAGRPVSVASHLGGMATGMLLGALISRRLLGRGRRDRPPAEVLPFPGSGGGGAEPDPSGTGVGSPGPLGRG